MFDATGRGGVARSVNLLASHLATRHEVHLHSVLRNTDEPLYPIDPRVEVTWLVDHRRGGVRRGRPRTDRWALPSRRRADSRPSALEPDDDGISAYTDLLLRRHLARLGPGLLVTTRPMLHVAAARWAPPSMPRVAWDHLNFERRMRNQTVRGLLDEAVPTTAALVTLTDADSDDYRLRYPGTRVRRIANASPFGVLDQAPLTDKVVVSGGRFVRRKGFDRLIEAWAPLAAELPDWRLEIHGEGELRPQLEAQVDELGVRDSVRLPGYSADFDRVLAGASCYALSSRTEGFPMVLLEATSHGLPLVAFDCPRGPAEIIDDGVNGRLVPDGDIAGLTAALRQVMGDAELRQRMGTASYGRARSYELSAVGGQWDSLLDEVAALPQPTG